MKKTELLAPAGNLESLRAAIAAGADAVYMGASAFSARAQAGFDVATLEEAIALAHLHGRRVYVAVNTLIKQREWPELLELLKQLDKLRPDAILVQDVGVLRQIKESLPQMQLHASTQMAVHNALGAQWLLKAGISRVVVARECSLDEIRQIADTGIEAEVFVHGALCVSVSGQCLLSSQIGGRSGNRGRCAQPCRLPYRYKDQDGALLSMRDLNTLEGIPQMLAAGVSSFKIEGRLKRPEYITEVVSIYRHALDLALAGQPLENTAQYQGRLAQVFNRGNFTKGHLFGAQDASLIGRERVSHEGLPIGRITKARRHKDIVLAECALTKQLNNGDGLQIRGQNDQEIIYSGRDVPVGEVATLRLREMPRGGEAVYRLADEAQLSSARARAGIMPAISFDAELALTEGQPARLRLTTDEGISATVTGDVPAPAKKQPLNEATAASYIGKTGGTPFSLTGLKVTSTAPFFMPAASLNQLRRDGLSALEEAILQGHQTLPARPWALKEIEVHVDQAQEPRLYAVVRDAETYQALKQARLCRLIYAPSDFRPGKLREALALLDREDIVALPPQMRDEAMGEAFDLIDRAGHVMMLGNISQLALPHRRAFIAGDGIPVWNNRAAFVLRQQGARAICLSRELAEGEIIDLDESMAEWILPVYGRSRVMLLNHCPERVRRGLSANRAGCGLCDRGEGLRGQALADRYQAAYPLHPVHFPEGCLIEMYHHSPIHLLDRAPRMSWLMDFVHETPEEALDVAQTYHDLMVGKSSATILPALGRFAEGVL
ncbi:MAG: peptidase U32 family protein [Christensenellales bacterium]